MMSVYSPSLPCSDPLDDEGLLHLEDEEDEEDGGFLMTSGCGRGGAEREGGMGYSQASGIVASNSHSSSKDQPFDRMMIDTGEGEDESLSTYVGMYGKNSQQIKLSSGQRGVYLHQEGEGGGMIIGRDNMSVDDENAYGNPSNGVYTPDKKTVLTSDQNPSANHYFNEASSSPSTLLVGGKGEGSLYDEKKSSRGGGVSLLSPSTPPASSSYRSQNNIGTKLSSSFMKKTSGGARGGRSSFLDFDGGAPMQVITGYETLCMDSFSSTTTTTTTTTTEGRAQGGLVSTGIESSASSTSSIPPSEVYVHPKKGSSDKLDRDEGGHPFEEEKQSPVDTAFLSSGGRGGDEGEEGLIDVSFASPQISPSSAGKQRGFQSRRGSERSLSIGQSYQIPTEEEEEEHDEDGNHFFSSSRGSTSFSSSAAKLTPPPVSSFPFDRSREGDDDKKSFSDGFRGIQGERETQTRMTFSSGNGYISPRDRDSSSASDCMYTSTHSPSSRSPSFNGLNLHHVVTEELEHIASRGGESASLNEKETSLRSSSTPTISLFQKSGASRNSGGFDRHSKSSPFRSPSPASCEDPEYGYENQTSVSNHQRSTLLGGVDEEGKREHQRSLLQKTSKKRGGEEEGRQQRTGFSLVQKGGSFLPFSLSFGGGRDSLSDSFSSSSPSLVQWKEVLSIVANRLYYSKYTAYLYAFVFIVNAWVLVRCLTLSAVDLPVVVAEVFVTTMLLFEVLLRALVVGQGFFSRFENLFDIGVTVLCVALLFVSDDLWGSSQVTGARARPPPEEVDDIFRQSLTAFRFSTQLLRMVTIALHQKRSRLPEDDVDFSYLEAQARRTYDDGL